MLSMLFETGTLISVLALLMVAAAAGEAASPDKAPFRKSVPPGAFEVVNVLGIDNSLVELKDGLLLANDGRVSTDMGKTWSAPKAFGSNISGDSLKRLKSGKLALSDGSQIWLSADEGKTWGSPTRIVMIGSPLNDSLTQLSTGRLTQLPQFVV